MFENREERDKNNETGLKEGRGIELSTTVLPLCEARQSYKYNQQKKKLKFLN